MSDFACSREAAPPRSATWLAAPPDDRAGQHAASRLEADFAPTACWERLRLRARLLQRLRRFFESRDFLEVETPILSHDTIADRHIDPLPVLLFDDPRQSQQGCLMWLQTSPEFAMKRLLACGGQRIYQVTKAFRVGEQGALHNPEFTIVEWYRVGDSLEDGMQLLGDLARELLEAPEVDRLSYRDAFQQHVGIDPFTASTRDLAETASRWNISVPQGMTDRDDWLDLLMAERVQPRLGLERPLILFDYPASQAALARVRDEDPAVAERFELFARGIELANGYHELLDAEVLRARNQRANTLRQADGKYPVPEESRLIGAMQHGLPPCSGVALGFDRLVMLAAQAESLAEILAFPISRA